MMFLTSDDGGTDIEGPEEDVNLERQDSICFDLEGRYWCL